jgi:glycosyltransferase involved in cell wall biosynthesis
MLMPDMGSEVAGERASPDASAIGPELTVLMPCLNEAATLPVCIEKAHESFRRLGLRGEVLIADNGSADGSQELARARGARVVEVQARGYGSALSAGIAAARSEWVIMGDADDSYDFSALDGFVAGLRAGNDLVVGNRFAGGIQAGAMPFLHRWLGNPILTFVARRFFGSPARDIYCGLRGFRRSAIERLDLRSTGMEYAIEMVVKSSLYGLRIEEVATTLSPDGRDRAPHLRTWRDGWRSLRFLLLYSPSWLFLYPGLALMAIGAVVNVLLAVRSRTIGGVTFEAHTMLYAAVLLIIGYQGVIFAAGARLFAITEGLLPADERWSRLFRFITLEVGIVIGVLCSAIGLAGSIYALLRWGDRSFGPFSYANTLRFVIPSATLLAIGSQTVLASFFLSILGLRRR